MERTGFGIRRKGMAVFAILSLLLPLAASVPAEAETAPIEVQVSDITRITFTVSWWLDEPLTGGVHWGETTALGNFKGDNRGVDVAASEPYEHKRELAAKYGAKTFNPHVFNRSTHGRKTYADHIREEFGEADAVFEMVGLNETLMDAIDIVRPGYRVMIFGAQKMQMIPYEKCRKKGVELVYPEATMNSKDDVGYWHAALDLIASKKLELEGLITNRISLEEAVRAFEYYNRAEWIKVLVEPFKD